MLQFIVDQAKANPNAVHISFAFSYDVDMILRNMSVRQFMFLRERGFCKYGDNFRVEHIPGKWFRVTQYGSAYPLIRKDKTVVTIFDSWGYFQSSLVKALKTTISDHPLMRHLEQIEAGKKERSNFTYAKLDYIIEYWKVENELFFALADRLRHLLYASGFYISSWHGPGSIAGYVYRTHGIREHKAQCGDAVYDAARFAYAGGRFERFHIGRFHDAYGFDINSAYPAAIAELPSLSEGTWHHVTAPKRFVSFAVYHIRITGPAISRRPGPLFHRDHAGNISYPWRTEGWYWAPELIAMVETIPEFRNITVIEGWEYTGWTTYPFAFVHDMYAERRAMKAAGNGAQMAYKLALNSLYGKMAQRAGWERTGKAPTWHQLEWAGWVTSHTRATLYRLMHRIPYDKLIAVETDGVFTTATPDELGITESTELGGWEVSHYDELIYLQSGVYAKRNGSDWSIKFRGLDNDSFGDTPEECARAISAHSILLGPGTTEWPNLSGHTTRFVGYRNALFRQEQNRGPMRVHHCVWEVDPKEISCGSIGKRIHSPRICAACKAGLNAYEMAHETVIKSRAMLATGNELWSTRHDIPWLDPDRAKWREQMAETEGLIIHD
jgi:hypothetical protein